MLVLQRFLLGRCRPDLFCVVLSRLASRVVFVFGGCVLCELRTLHMRVFVSDMVTPKTTPKLGTCVSGVGKINSVLSC